MEVMSLITRMLIFQQQSKSTVSVRVQGSILIIMNLAWTIQDTIYQAPLVNGLPVSESEIVLNNQIPN